MVVAGRAAGGERVAQPEAVGLGDTVGDVGEGRGALVGGDDQVGVVLVVADHVGRVDDLAADQVVGDVQQRRDEGLVGRDALGQPGVTVHRRVRQLLGDEAALGADRHDDGVLHHLRLDQAEDLGAEVLAPVGPAQTAAGDLAEAQVHALDLRRVDPDLERRARGRQVRDGLRVELHRHVGVPGAGAVVLEEVGPQGGLDEVQEGAQDAVLVQRDDLVQRAVQLLQDALGQLQRALLVAGAEPGLEEVHQQAGGVGVVAERVLHVVLGERGARLAQVLGVRAQHHRLAPGQPGGQDEVVEAVVLGQAGPGGGEGLLEAVAGLVGQLDGLAQPQTEVVHPGGGVVGAGQRVRVLVEHLDAQSLEDRQHLGERDRAAHPVDLEAALVVAGADRLVEVQPEVAVAVQRLDLLEVRDRGARGEVRAVTVGEGVGVLAGELGGLLLAQLDVQLVVEPVHPEPGGLGQLGLDPLDLGVRQVRQLAAGGDPHDEVQSGQHRLRRPDRVVDRGAVELLHQDVHEAQPDAGGVAVARQVDQRGEVAPVLVLAQEQPQPAALLEVEHAGGDLQQLVGRSLEDLVPGEGLQDLQQVAAVVALGGEAGVDDDVLDLAADDRDAADRLGVGGGREQAEEAALADDHAVGVELLHADVVEVGRAVHGRPAVGLGEDEQLLLVGLGAHRRGQPAEGLADGVVLVVVADRVGAQDAEAGPGDGLEDLLALVLDQVVLAVAEEGEVVVGEPAHELPGLADLLLGQAGRGLLGELVGQTQRGVAHLGPVLDDLADVAEHPAQVGLDLAQVVAVGLAVDLDVHPRLDGRVGRPLGAGGLAAGAGVDVEDLQQLAGDVAADDQLGVDDDVDRAVLAGQLVGHRVDQERHVVGDDLDHGVAAGPAVLLDRGGVHPHLGGALGALEAQAVVRGGRAVDVDRVAVDQVLGRRVEVVVVQVRGQSAVAQSLPRRRSPHLAVLSGCCCLPEQFGLGCVQLGLHDFLAPVARRCVTRWWYRDPPPGSSAILPHHPAEKAPWRAWNTSAVGRTQRSACGATRRRQPA